MKYPVYNQQGEKVQDIELNELVFSVATKKEVVHQVLVAQEANKRTAVAHTKQRGDVRGGGRKPWRQKGTGRARHGTIRSPLWKGGGVTFGPLNVRNFSQKVNKKMKRQALFMTLSDKAASSNLILVDKLELTQAKTKPFVQAMQSMFARLDIKLPVIAEKTATALNPAVKKQAKKTTGTDKDKFAFKTLIIVPQTDMNLIRSSNNLPRVKVIRADSLNVKDILHYDWLVAPVQSLQVIEQVYLK